MARPQKVVEPSDIEKLAREGHTNDEIAIRLNISVSTLSRRYDDILKRGRHFLTASLRSKQVSLALAGDKTMLIWLGKQLLGQRDKNEISGPDGGPIQHEHVDLSRFSSEQLSQLEGLVESAYAGTNQG